MYITTHWKTSGRIYKHTILLFDGYHCLLLHIIATKRKDMVLLASHRQDLMVNPAHTHLLHHAQVLPAAVPSCNPNPLPCRWYPKESPPDKLRVHGADKKNKQYLYWAHVLPKCCSFIIIISLSKFWHFMMTFQVKKKEEVINHKGQWLGKILVHFGLTKQNWLERDLNLWPTD